MLLTLQEMMELLCLIADERKMTAAFERSVYGALIAGAGAFAGGVMGGLLGIAVGSALGGAVGASIFRGNYIPVRQIIMGLSHGMQQLLYHKVSPIIRRQKQTDMASLTALVMTDGNVQNQLVGVLAKFLTKEVGVKIHYGK